MATRKNRRNRSRRNRRSNKQAGGMAPLGNSSMNMSSQDSLGQGSQYLQMHKGQYGGSAPIAAVTNSVLPSSMVAAARTGPLDSAIAGIQGMHDGGRRRNKKHSKKHHSRKHSRKHSGGKSRKHSKKHHSRKHSRKHSGGSAPLSADSMLLPPGMERQAALNYEWSMAKNPGAFAPPK